MGRRGAGAVGHSRCLRGTRGAARAAGATLAGLGSRMVCPPIRAAATVLVEHGKHFQPRGKGDECLQQFPKNSTLLFKHCPSSAPVWFLYLASSHQ